MAYDRRKLFQNLRQFAIDSAVEAVLELVKEDFLMKSIGSEGRDGIKWKPLSPVTIKQKGHDLILIDTGALFAHIRARVLSDKSGEIRASEKPWHHEGREGLPSRPFWPKDGQFPEAWIEEFEARTARGLAQRLEKEYRAKRTA